MPHTRAGDLNIHYDSYGDGIPLLVINGFGASSYGLRPEFVEGLARSFRVITFDNRGAGDSDKPDAPYSIAQLADDAAGLLEATGIDRAHVMGISMGGMIAQEVALRHQRKVLGLVLGCTNCGAPNSIAAEPEILNLLMIPEDMDPREAVRRSRPASYTPEFIAANGDLLDAIMERSLAHPTPLYARNRQMMAIREWNSHDRLDQITAPTLIIAGDQDVLVPPGNANILHERIKGSRLHIIPGAAHVFPGSHPEETVRSVTEFLQTVAIPAAV
ncbi:MAG: alpha/beta fold hydrolase [Dehalococcoidia bacterium]